jgi:predicted RND superfamily exporter protein
VALVVVVITAVALNALPKLRSSDNFFAMFTVRDSARPLAEEAEVRVNNNPCLIALESDELFTSKGLTALRDLQASLAQTEGVDRVTSLYDIRKPVLRGVYRQMFPGDLADAEKIAEFRDLIAKHPMVKDQLLSADGRATLLIVELKPEFHTSAEFRPVIERIEKQVSELTRDANIVTKVTGPPVIQVGVTDALIKDQIVFNIAGPCVAMLIAFVLFRRLASVLIVTAAPILGVIWTLGWFALSGEELNPINGVVAPLTLTIGMADAVHVLFHIRHTIATGSTPRDAAAQSIRDVGAACVLTSLTTAIGFASMAIADFELLRQFGIDCTVGVVMAFIAVLTVVPLLGSTPLGRRTVVKMLTDENNAESKLRPLGRWHGRMARFAVRYRVPVFVGSLIITSLLVWSSQYLPFDIKLQRGLPTGPTKQAFLHVDEQFGGSLPFILEVRWSPDEPPEPEELVKVVTAAQRTLTGSGINSPPLSILTMFEMMPGQDRSPERLVRELQKVPDEYLNLFYDEEHGRASIVTRFRDNGSADIERLANEMDRTLAVLGQEHPGFHFDKPDCLPITLRAASGVILDLLNSLFGSVVVTIVIIGLALRSVRFGLIALLPNIFPMAALAGTMLFLGIPMLVIVATVFVICFGIAVDDTIHVLTVFGRLQREGVPTHEAIERTYADIGDAIISTTIILVSGIAVVMLGQSVTTKYFGGLFIVGLLWALVGDLLILPASLACFPPRSPTAKD